MVWPSGPVARPSDPGKRAGERGSASHSGGTPGAGELLSNCASLSLAGRFMALLFLVRHAQASFAAANYDVLSELGRQQSRLLGEYFAGRGLSFARVVHGTLQRQRDTALRAIEAMPQGAAELRTEPGLDEYHAEALYGAHTGGRDPREHQRGDYRDYWRTFRSAMARWTEDGLAGVPETWGQFGDRVMSALTASVAGLGRDDAVLVVSSGGAIGRALAVLLGSPGQVAIELNLQFRNTGICEIIAGNGVMRVVSVNALPHLDQPGRREMITAT